MTISRQSRLLVSLVWGILIGSATFGVHAFAALSQHAAVILLQIACMYLIIPGLIVSRGLAGNHQSFSLVVAAIVNAAFHFALCWAVLRMLLHAKPIPSKHRAKSQRQSS